MALGPVGMEPDRLAGGDDRLVGPPDPVEVERPMVAGVGEIGPEPDRRFLCGDGVAEELLAFQGLAQPVLELGVVGGEPDRLLVKR
jgi:hypothetical protein